MLNRQGSTPRTSLSAQDPRPSSRAELTRRLHAAIPGGAHTYAKGDDQWPETVPALIARGEGCHVWDTDGNKFLEYAPGSRAVTLGHAYPAVVEAAARQLTLGVNFTRPAAIELEAAERLLELIPAANMVKFTKDGSTATSAAVKLARAHTGRDMVAICADHPFFSYDDWYIGTTEVDAGIPPEIPELSVGFRYNDLESLRAVFREHPDRIAGVILEAEKNEPPLDGFLHGIQDLCAAEGSLFILDEMITGFRYDLPGAQTLYGLTPDLSAFGKAMANGFSVSALVGKSEIMELGGLEHAGERVFLLSTTHGGETHALAAALATMDVYGSEPVIETLRARGERLRAGVDEVVASLGLTGYFEVFGQPSNLVFATRDADHRPSQPLRTLFMQEMVRRGILAPSFVVTYSHGEAEIDRTIEVVAESLDIYSKALEGGVDRYLQGRSIKPVYRRFN
jgi:glutamate-1-semialdehyde 2,1-aminomutase